MNRTMREKIEILYVVHDKINANEITESTGYPLSYIKICIADMSKKKGVFVQGVLVFNNLSDFQLFK